jgi:hypothetical protein
MEKQMKSSQIIHSDELSDMFKKKPKHYYYYYYYYYYYLPWVLLQQNC